MIRLLDAVTIGQIAAGEVIERPLSVVKELVENALDAGASRVEVSIRRGGLERIEVADDGAGIARDDLRLAVARHATSKLTGSGDLERISTLGFRGEGLASIAAVARLRLISRLRGEQIAHAVDAFGEASSEPEPLAGAEGTRAIVTALFENVPVRREYLRSPSAEFARISSFLATLSLGYPAVTFSLRHDGKEVWVFPASDALEARLAHVFGVAPARALLALQRGERVSGYVSKPGFERGDRRMQVLFVNGRLLRSTLLAGVWSAAYATFTLAGRQPYGVLFLHLPADQVDPNVHPTKSDVRLRRPERLFDEVRRAIAATLEGDARSRFVEAVSFAPPDPARIGGGAGAVTEGLDGAAAPNGQTASFAFPEMPEHAGPRVLAQLDDTYILATDGSALMLVDQHAAHERVAYETIVDRARKGGPSEPLLVPYVFELGAEEALRFETVRETLAEAGFVAEPFGDRAYRVTATPSGYGARAFRIEPFLSDVRDEIGGLSAQERIWATLACHSVARAGDRLDPAEMAALIAALVRCRNPMHCPHGRPTIVRIEPEAVARMFKRT